MRLLLDEMISAAVAEQLRARSHEVTSVQDPALTHLRGVEDYFVFEHAANERRAVVTDNVEDFLRCHRRRIDAWDHHHGLLLLTNRAFPRHRHDTFVRALIAALEVDLGRHQEDDDTSWIRWLQRAE